MHRLFLVVIALLSFAMLEKVNAQVADDYVLQWVGKLAKELNEKFAVRPFEYIGWAKDLRTAQALAKEHDRPIFLFTLNGQMNTGRC